MLNDTQLEEAAKEYCRLAGLDPFELVQCDVEGSFAYYQHPRWRGFAEEIKKHALFSQAIAFVVPGSADA